MRQCSFTVAFAFFLIMGCSSARKTAEPAPSSAPADPVAIPSAKEVTAALQATADALPSAPAPAAPEKHHAAPEGADPNQALGWLQNGNKRFIKGWVRKDGQAKKDVERLSHGQKPHAIVLSCSDSRVPPEVVFDQKLGELFVVRTAGESLDDNVIGSIEYAIEHLGSRLLVVLGHTSCGAVNAALKTLDGGDAGSPALNRLVADIHPRIKASAGVSAADGAPQSLANAKGVAQDLIQRSALIRSAVEQGRVLVKTAVYDLKSGEVKF